MKSVLMLRSALVIASSIYLSGCGLPVVMDMIGKLDTLPRFIPEYKGQTDSFIKVEGDCGPNQKVKFDYTSELNPSNPAVEFKCPNAPTGTGKVSSTSSMGPITAVLPVYKSGRANQTFNVRIYAQKQSILWTNPDSDVRQPIKVAWMPPKLPDTVPPTITWTQTPTDPSGVNVSFGFKVEDFGQYGEPGSGISSTQCQIDAGTRTDCVTDYAATLTAGPHKFTVYASDAGGNSSSLSYSWTVDATIPSCGITGVPNYTNATSFTATLTCNGGAGATLSSVECQTDSLGYQPCPSFTQGSFTGYTSQGAHTINVRATNNLGNQGSTNGSFVFDNAKPVVNCTTPLYTTSSTISFSSSGTTGTYTCTDTGGVGCSMATAQCFMDGQPQSSCSGIPQGSQMSEGTHQFQVKMADLAGNLSDLSSACNIIYDNSKPTIAITGSPDVLTATQTAQFTFTGTDINGSGIASYQCKWDGGTYAPCVSGVQQTVADGNHTFSVKSIDNVGLESQTPATFSWTVSSAAPTCTITSSVPARTNQQSQNISFSCTGTGTITSECRVDSNPFTTCTSPFPTGSLGDGPHTFELKAKNNINFVYSALKTASWTVDTAAPTTTCSPAITNWITSNSFNATTTCTDNSGNACQSTQCRIDGGNFGPCISFTGLTSGNHLVEVRGTDDVGNIQASGFGTCTFGVDFTGPVVTITQKPSANTNSTSADFSFSATDDRSGVASYECKLDAGSFAACNSMTFSQTNLTEATHTFQVRAKDVAGNTGATVSYSWTINLSVPSCSIGTIPTWITTNSQSVSFTCTAGTGGATIASTTCTLDGSTVACGSSPFAATALSEGSHSFTIRATNNLGTSSATNSTSWSVDTKAPTATCSGFSGWITSTNYNATTTCSDFTPGSTCSAVECSLDSGSFTSTCNFTALTQGNHTILARGRDVAGNVQSTGYGQCTFSVDNVVPTITIITKPPLATGNQTADFTFSGSDPGGSGIAGYLCQIDGSSFQACNGGSANYTNLAQGSHTFTVKATDTAGNTSAPASYTWSVNLNPPTCSIITAFNPAFRNQISETISYDCNDPLGVTLRECAVDNIWGTCTTSTTHSVGPLSAGPHVFSVRATNTAGLISVQKDLSWTIDLVAPTTSCAGPSGWIGISSYNASVTCADSGGSGCSTNLECKLDSGNFASSCSFTNLTEGSHVIATRATDMAGNVQTSGFGQCSFSVDLTAPTVAINSKPSTPTAQLNADFAFSGNDGTGSGIAGYFCKMDSDPSFVACNSGTFSRTNLLAGIHNFYVYAQDNVGKTSATATYTWTIDLSVPTCTISPAPPSWTNQSTITVNYSCSDTNGISLRKCSVDSAPELDCTGTTSQFISGLTAGSHSLSIRAQNTLGTWSSAQTTSWSVDLTAPTSSCTGASGWQSSTSYIATPSCTDAASGCSPTFNCKLDSGAFGTSCSFTGITSGNHTVYVQATDMAGNVQSSGYGTCTFSVDTGNPTVTILTKPTNPTASTTATFTFSGTDLESGIQGFLCQLDGAGFSACNGGSISYSALTSGSHTFHVKSLDLVGNQSTPASYTWTVDPVPPTCTITPLATTWRNQSSETVSFSCTGSQSISLYECKLDTNAYTTCSSSISHTMTGLTESAHTLTVRATNVLGTMSTPVSTSWSTDLTAPISGCTGTSGWIATTSYTATPSCTDTGGSNCTASQQCKLDTGVFSTTCNFTGLTEGAHTVYVKAFDNAGNAQSVGFGQCSFSVDTTIPTVSIGSKPSNPTASNQADFSFTGSDGSGSGIVGYLCKLDSAPSFSSCNSGTVTYTGLADGSHTFFVKSVDGVGFQSTTAQYTWSIDSSKPSCTITSPVASSWSNSSSQNFAFSCSSTQSITSYQCKLDSNSYAPCTSSTTHSSSGLTEGPHTFYVMATNSLGVSSVPATVSWNIDMTGPGVVSFQNPSANIFSNAATYNFTWLGGTDNVGGSGASGLYRVEVCAQLGCATPTTVITSSPANYLYTLGADASVNFVCVQAKDNAGNLGTKSCSPTVTRDLTAPAIQTLAGPTSPTNSTSASFTFTKNDFGGSGDVPVQGSAVTSYCKLDSGSYVSCNSGVTYSVGNGAHTFYVYGVDAVGNMGTVVTYPWNVSTTGPSCNFTTTIASWTNTTTQSISFTCSDPAFSISKIQCSLNGATYADCTSPQNLTGLANGGQTFSIKAQNSALTWGSPQSISWSVDTQAPTTTCSGPSVIATTGFTPTKTCTDNVSGSGCSGTFECKLDSGSFTSTCSFNALSEATHTIQVRAYDVAGNVTTTPSSCTVTVDLTPPPLTLSPASACVNASGTVNISGACENGLAILATGPGNFSPSPITCSSLSYSSSISAISGADGVKTFSLSQTDGAGWTTTKTIDITKDTIAPTPLTITYPISTSWVSQISHVAGQCEANLPLTISGSMPTINTTCPATGTYDVAFTYTPASGAVSVTVSQTDCASNTSTVSVSGQQIDGVPPSVAFLTPANGSFVGATVTLNGSCSDNGQTVRITGAFTDNGGSKDVVCSGSSFTSGLLTLTATDGVKTFSARHWDAAGNFADSPAYSLSKDTVPPVANCTSQTTWLATAPGRIDDNPPYDSTYTSCTDATSGCDYTKNECQLNGTGAFSSANCNFTTNFNGTYVIRYYDKVGLSATSPSCAMKIDNQAPVLSFVSPSSGNYFTQSGGSGLTFTFQANDNGGSGIVSYSIQKYAQILPANISSTGRCAGTPSGAPVGPSTAITGANYQSSYSYSPAISSQGAYDVKITGVDGAGNSSSICGRIYVDNTPPTLGSFRNPAAAVEVPVLSYTFIWDPAVDNESGLPATSVYKVSLFNGAGCATGQQVTDPATSQTQFWIDSNKWVIKKGMIKRGYSYSFQVEAVNNSNMTSSPICSATVKFNPAVQSIALGDAHGLAIVNGGLVAWGYRGQGRIGTGSGSGNQDVPIKIVSPYPADYPPGSGLIGVAAGLRHSLVIIGGPNLAGDLGGRVECFGDNSSGQCGSGNTTTQDTPTPVLLSPGVKLTGVTQVTGGDKHSCALVGGSVYCWGYNSQGQLGDGTTTSRYYATPIAAGDLGTKTVSKIVSGDANTCALAEGSVYCWGYNSKGLVAWSGSTYELYVAVPRQVLDSTNAPLTGVRDIAGGARHACAIKDDAVYCWGDNNLNQLGLNDPANQKDRANKMLFAFGAPLAGKQVLEISAGDNFTCVNFDGGITCVGNNNKDQLGNNGIANAYLNQVPAFASGSGVMGLVSGKFTSCAFQNGTPKCWGDDAFGETGTGITGTSAPVPYILNSITNVASSANDYQNSYIPAQTSSGGEHSCGIVKDSFLCWGSSLLNQLGSPLLTGMSVMSSLSSTGIFGESGSSTAAATNIQQVSAGKSHTCVVTNGKAHCFGSDTNDALGNSSVYGSQTKLSSLASNNPTIVRANASVAASFRTSTLDGSTYYLNGVVQVSAGNNFTCALVNSAVFCWGGCINGQCGLTGSFGTNVSEAKSPVIATGVTQVATGDDHACAIQYGKIWCWGLNDKGQIGANSSTASTATPQQVSSASGIITGAVALSLGAKHSCALVQGGKVYCWGSNSNSQLGSYSSADTSFHNIAVYVKSNSTTDLSGAHQIASGGNHSCANVRGQVFCWGSNASGEIGRAGGDALYATLADTFQFIKDDGTSTYANQGVTAVSAGQDNTCVQSNGNYHCWGKGDKGQLGNDTFTSVSSPELVR